MGRLFWKFFFFIWLAQLTTTAGVTSFFWWEHQRDDERRPPRPPMERDFDRRRPPPPGGPGPEFRPGPPPHRPRLPVEPLVAGLLGSVAFAALLARYFSRPIRTLRSAFEATASGDLDLRIGAAMGKRRDELADLGRDFDRMADQLRVLVNGQRRLLHDVSHELRSPLARLQAAIGLARQQPERLESSMERIEKESVRIDGLVGELLTLARLEAGTEARPRETIELAALLADIVADARFEASSRGVQVEFEPPCEAVATGDPELLHRAIENIVRNAVKYSPPGGSVRISSSLPAGTGQARIRVTDTGPGVPEEDLERIFEPFYRGSRPRDADGHGLGLAIARRVAGTMEGSITASNLPDGGLCMEITLPAQENAGGRHSSFCSGSEYFFLHGANINERSPSDP